MTLKELIQRSLDIASGGTGAAVVTMDTEAIVEPLLPVVFRAVGTEAARTERTRTLLHRAKAIVFVDGVVDLSTDQLTEYIRDSSLSDSVDVTKRYAYTEWDNFIRPNLDTRLGYYSLEGEHTLHVTEPGTSYDPLTGPAISLRLDIPCVPVVPVSLTGTVDAPDEIVIMLIEALAAALRPATAKV